MSDYTKGLGFADDVKGADRGIVCVHCDTRFSGGWDGAVLRSHRRRCAVHPEDVYEPAATGRVPRSAFSTKGYDLW